MLMKQYVRPDLSPACRLIQTRTHHEREVLQCTK